MGEQRKTWSTDVKEAIVLAAAPQAELGPALPEDDQVVHGDRKSVV